MEASRNNIDGKTVHINSSGNELVGDGEAFFTIDLIERKKC